MNIDVVAGSQAEDWAPACWDDANFGNAVVYMVIYAPHEI